MRRPALAGGVEGAGAGATAVGRWRAAAATVAWWLAAAWVLLNLAVAAAAPHADFFDAQVQLGAARAVLQGRDPYGQYVQNPLWTLLLLTPYAALPERTAYLAQFAGNTGMWFVAAWLVLRAGGATWDGVKQLVAAGALCTYLPVVWSTHGTVTAYHGLAVAAFLTWVDRRPAAAGAALVLLAAKPHLGLPLAGAVALWASLSGRWRVLAGMAASGTALAGLSLAVRPGWPWQWAHAVLAPEPEIVEARARYAPTVAHVAGRWLPPLAAGAVAAAVSVATVGGLAAWVARSRRVLTAHGIVGVALPATFLVTPYAQGYDLSLLLPTLALLAAACSRSRGGPQAALAAGLATIYLFPYLVQLLGWPQATLLPSAALALALAAASHNRLAPARCRGD